MGDQPRKAISDMFDALVEVGRRISATERDQRPHDQPRGPGARMVATHWLLSPAVAVEIENAAELFTDGLCPACNVPLGTRNEEQMRVRYVDPIGRSCDGLQARTADTLRGPRAQLYSERFLAQLSNEERATSSWRPVEVSNRKKTKRSLFELRASQVEVKSVELRGGYLNRFECLECGYQSAPVYALAGAFPDWLNPKGELAYGGQPSVFISSEQLPTPVPSLFTLRGPRHGPALAISGTRGWPKAATPGVMGVSRHPLGVVAGELVVEGISRQSFG